MVLLRRVLLFALLAMGLPVAGCGGLALSAMAANNRMVTEWTDTFSRYPKPPRSELLRWARSEFGLLEGNGNHCDIRLTLTLDTELTAREVEAYYEASGLVERLGAARGGLAGVDVWVRGTPGTQGRSVVRVELFSHGGNLGDGGGFDPRCH